jgi:estrogen-related receptor beta like 1
MDFVHYVGHYLSCHPYAALAVAARCTELISERNNELHRLASALEDAKQQLDSRGSNLSDTSPLVRLKAAMASLKAELRQMELRIGVVSHQVSCSSSF